jgi:hypothetical protein
LSIMFSLLLMVFLSSFVYFGVGSTANSVYWFL